MSARIWPSGIERSRASIAQLDQRLAELLDRLAALLLERRGELLRRHDLVVGEVFAEAARAQRRLARKRGVHFFGRGELLLHQHLADRLADVGRVRSVRGDEPARDGAVAIRGKEEHAA
jgi:hypothetical protein